MTLFESILLGLFQGLTEFLPISSSGHLILVQNFLGMKNLNNYILFDLVCHLGTLSAILCVYSDEIIKILTRDRTHLAQLCLATLPLFPLALLMKEIKHIYNQPQFLWIFFLITAVLLCLGNFKREKHPERLLKTKWRDSLVIGLFQAGAIFPGISRSGSTISAAKLLGWTQDKALTFSFLLAIPTILGGAVLETYHLMKSPIAETATVGPLAYFTGFIVSFAAGYGTLKFISCFMSKEKLYIFVIYCIFISTLCFFVLS